MEMVLFRGQLWLWRAGADADDGDWRLESMMKKRR
jgi:hypothetical protein